MLLPQVRGASWQAYRLQTGFEISQAAGRLKNNAVECGGEVSSDGMR